MSLGSITIGSFASSNPLAFRSIYKIVLPFLTTLCRDITEFRRIAVYLVSSIKLATCCETLFSRYAWIAPIMVGSAMLTKISPMASVIIISTRLYPTTLVSRLRRDEFILILENTFFPIWHTTADEVGNYPLAQP